MKILFIIESLRSGGKERRLVELIKGLQHYNEIELILLKPEIHYNEIETFKIRTHKLKRNLRKDIKILIKFNKIVNSFNPDIVHCWDNIAAIHFGPICKIKGIPFINSMITTAPPSNLVKIYSKRFISTAISYPFSTVILSNSKAGLLAFKAPKKKAKCIYNGFDFNRIKSIVDKNIILEKHKIRTKYVVGMTASFSVMKDYYTYVKAAEIVLQNRNDVTFLAIGSGPLMEQVKKSISYKNSVFFRFLGKQQDVESIVNIFDIGILSTFTEGVSNSIMEYMALCKPVVATDGGGTKELVVDKETGFLIKPQNAEELADKIIFLLENPNEAKTMGEKGKKRIEEYFSISKMVNETLQLYKDQIK